MEVQAYCPDCRKDKKFKLYTDILTKLERCVQILASCATCHKGKWVELTHEQFEKLPK